MSIFRQQLLLACFFCFLFVTGCGSDTPQTEELTTCTPSTGEDPNPYRKPDTSDAYLIYQASQPVNLGASLLPSSQTSQKDAFNLLEEQVKDWSAYEDILVEGNLIIRITITYVSPELVEALVLNQTLYSGILSSADFLSQVKAVKTDIAKREELLFLITITASEYRDKILPDNGLMIDIPLKDLTLTNSANLSVVRRHADQILDDEINLRSGPEYGYLGFPIAVQKDGVCQLVIDTTWDTSLTLHTPNLIVDSTMRSSLTWGIGMHPLVDMNAPSIDLDELMQMGSVTTPTTEASYYSPIEDPPLPINGISKTEIDYWDTYWDHMSRYIWYYLTNKARH